MRYLLFLMLFAVALACASTEKIHQGDMLTIPYLLGTIDACDDARALFTSDEVALKARGLWAPNEDEKAMRIHDYRVIRERASKYLYDVHGIVVSWGPQSRPELVPDGSVVIR